MKDNNEDSDLQRITGKRKISDEENSQPETTLYPPRITHSVNPSPRTEPQTSMNRPQINYRTGLPYGYRFQPTDVELVLKYLKPKVANPHFMAPEITEADIYGFHPQELLERNPERNAFYFSQTQKVSEKGTRVKRTVGENSGLWQNSGTKPIEGLPGEVIAYKNSFTFYNGKSKKTGDKTQWLMKEFVLNQGNNETTMMNKEEVWVLCHLYDSRFYKDAAASVGGADVLLREEDGLNTQLTVEGEKRHRNLGHESDSRPQPPFRNDSAHYATAKVILGTTASTSSNVTTTAGTSTATTFFSIINPAVPSHQGPQQQLVSESNSGDDDTDGSINTNLTPGITASTSSNVTTTASTSSATMSVSATPAVPSHPGQQQQQKSMSNSGDNCITEVEVRGNVEAREQMLIGSPEPNTKLSL